MFFNCISMSRFIPDSFILGIIISLLLSYFLPWSVAYEQMFPLSVLIKIGVALIFFFYGLKLKTEEMIDSLKNWKLHLLVQSTSFIIMPLLVLPGYFLVVDTEFYNLWLSILFLSALPSALSSSVVLISIAGGNISSAIFNASISGLLAVVFTPLWLGMFQDNTNFVFSFYDIILTLSYQIFLPLCIGLFFRKKFFNWTLKNSYILSWFDKIVILLIIYKSFGISFSSGIFAFFSLKTLISLSLISVCLFSLTYYITIHLSRLFSLTHENSIVFKYCGSQKSLIHASVLVSLLFPDSQARFMLIPIMIYHPFQLFVLSYFSKKKLN